MLLALISLRLSYQDKRLQWQLCGQVIHQLIDFEVIYAAEPYFGVNGLRVERVVLIIGLHVFDNLRYFERVRNTTAGVNDVYQWRFLKCGDNCLHKDSIGDEIARDHIQHGLGVCMGKVKHSIQGHHHLEAACCDGVCPAGERICVAALNDRRAHDDDGHFAFSALDHPLCQALREGVSVGVGTDNLLLRLLNFLRAESDYICDHLFGI